MINLWDKHAQVYEDNQETLMQQNALSLYCITHAHRAKRICEAGTGCGLGARVLIGEFMKHGSVLFASDYSQEMCRIFRERLEESSMGRDTRVTIKTIEDPESVDFHKELEDPEGTA